MANLAETIATTLTSGFLTAVGAYSAIVWKLTKRVTVLEQKIGELDSKAKALKESDDELEEKQTQLRIEVSEQLLEIKEEMSKQLVDSSHRILQRLDEIHTKLGEDMGDFRTNCSERTSRYLPRATFEQYAKEEERRWQEFYRAVGKLEAVIDRALRTSTPPAPRLIRIPDDLPPTGEDR